MATSRQLVAADITNAAQALLATSAPTFAGLTLQPSGGSSFLSSSYDSVTANALTTTHGYIKLPQSGVTGKGPFVVYTGRTDFLTTPDVVGVYGYNQDAGGALIQSSENGLALFFETDYNDGASRKMEFYLQYKSANAATTLRPIFYQFDRTLNTITGAIIMTGSTQLNITSPSGTQLVHFPVSGGILVDSGNIQTANKMIVPNSGSFMLRSNTGSYMTDGGSADTIVFKNSSDVSKLNYGVTTADVWTFPVPIAIGNTVNSVSPTSPNRTVTISIGGTTYYLAAKTSND